MDFDILEGKCSFCLREGIMVHMFEDSVTFFDQSDALISSCKGCLERMLESLEDTVPPMYAEEEANVYD